MRREFMIKRGFNHLEYGDVPWKYRTGFLKYGKKKFAKKYTLLEAKLIRFFIRHTPHFDDFVDIVADRMVLGELVEVRIVKMP